MSQREEHDDQVVELKQYRVTGRQRVREISPGELVELDPENPETQRLLGRGQITDALVDDDTTDDGDDADTAGFVFGTPPTGDDPDDGADEDKE